MRAVRHLDAPRFPSPQPPPSGRGGKSDRCLTRLLGVAGQRRRLTVLAQIPTFHDLARQ